LPCLGTDNNRAKLFKNITLLFNLELHSFKKPLLQQISSFPTVSMSDARQIFVYKCCGIGNQVDHLTKRGYSVMSPRTQHNNLKNYPVYRLMNICSILSLKWNFFKKVKTTAIIFIWLLYCLDVRRRVQFCIQWPTGINPDEVGMALKLSQYICVTYSALVRLKIKPSTQFA